jgi:hypothetical protein
MVKKVILQKLPKFSHKEQGISGDLVAIVTETTDTHVHTAYDPSMPTIIYIGYIISRTNHVIEKNVKGINLRNVISCEKRIDNALKLSLTKNEHYEVTLVDTIVSKNPAWLLKKEGSSYLRKNLPNGYKKALRL